MLAVAEEATTVVAELDGLGQKRLLVAEAGGSGYIGNKLLNNKVMYGYNVEASSEPNTLTVSTTASSETATANYAKLGDGYAIIIKIQ